MLIDFSQGLALPDGEKIYIDKDKKEVLTLGSLSLKGLYQVDPDQKTAQRAGLKHTIGCLIYSLMGKEKKIDIEEKDIVLIKKHIGFIGTPIVIKIAWDMLENKSEIKK